MDFFSEQDQARKNTKVLIGLFVLAVVTLIGLTNILFALLDWTINEQITGKAQAYQQAIATLHYQSSRSFTYYFSWQRFGLISLAVTAVVACAIIFKWSQLSGGGKRVAEQLGGERVYPNTNDPDQQRLLNVVEEMAIASGMPVPSVYLLPHEVGINAFAAGSTAADAVIGVTQGSLVQFNREQLQGVVAHEFSHILNGDMRLNIRLIAVLHGILFIGLVGEMLLRSSSRRGFRVSRRRSSNNGIALFGFALLVVGWLGRFFGNWIKSSVSRQREFLADAHAVQFTRNPNGISDALKIIGGYLPAAQLQTKHASEMSHLFFGQASGTLHSMFATHPPLESRISRIEPQWNGQFIFREIITNHQQPSSDTNSTSSQHNVTADTLASLAATGSLISTGFSHEVDNTLASIPVFLIHQAHEPFTAMAMLYALLLSDNIQIQQKQLSYIDLTKTKGLPQQTLDLYPQIAALNSDQRLPLIQMSLPALKCMSEQQYKAFSKTLLLLIRADKEFELFEWCMYQLTRHFLEGEFSVAHNNRPLYKQANQVAPEFELVLSMLCHYGENTSEDIQQAFGRGANFCGLYTIKLLDKNDCHIAKFVTATNTLAQCYPLLKPKLIKALVECAKHDQRISSVESEMIHAIAAVMDSPMPQLS